LKLPSNAIALTYRIGTPSGKPPSVLLRVEVNGRADLPYKWLIVEDAAASDIPNSRPG
jgi:hypothetical protein